MIVFFIGGLVLAFSVLQYSMIMTGKTYYQTVPIRLRKWL